MGTFPEVLSGIFCCDPETLDSIPCSVSICCCSSSVCWPRAWDLFPFPCSVPSFPDSFPHIWLFVPGLFYSLPSPSLHLSGVLSYRIFPWAHYLSLNHHLDSLSNPTPNYFIQLFFLSLLSLCPCFVVLFSSCPTNAGFLSVRFPSSLSPLPSPLSYPAGDSSKSSLLFRVSLSSLKAPSRYLLSDLSLPFWNNVFPSSASS